MNRLALLIEPTRARILRLVWDEERSAGEIASCFDVTFGAVSQHLALLRRARVVKRRREGRMQFYRADRAAVGAMSAVLEAVWSAQDQERTTALARSDRRTRLAIARLVRHGRGDDRARPL